VSDLLTRPDYPGQPSVTVPDLVLSLATAGGVDTVGVPAWLGRPVREYLTSHSAKVRCGSVVTGDN
jgi:hypothetical protein